MHDQGFLEGAVSHACLQLEIQMRTNTLVLQVREEHRTGILKHTDALVGLADDMEDIKHLLSRALDPSRLSHSLLQRTHVCHHGSSLPLQSTGITVRPNSP